MKPRIKNEPLLIAWVNDKGKIQYMSNMTNHQKTLVINSINRKENNNAKI
jgi:hypothetical protein